MDHDERLRYLHLCLQVAGQAIGDRTRELRHRKEPMRRVDLAVLVTEAARRREYLTEYQAFVAER